MDLVVGGRPVRPLTADEVMRMVQTGILREDERVELPHGVLTAVSPQSPQHVEINMRLTRWLDAAIPRFVVRRPPTRRSSRISTPPAGSRTVG